MKILKPRISIVILSICFLWNHTEMLHALHFDAKAPEAPQAKPSAEKTDNQKNSEMNDKTKQQSAKKNQQTADARRAQLNPTDSSTTSVANSIHTDSPTTSPQTGIKLSDNTSTDQNTTKPSINFVDQSTDNNVAHIDANNSQPITTEPVNSHDSAVSGTDATTHVEKQLFKEESTPDDAQSTNQEIKPDNSAEKSDLKESDLNAKKQEKMSTISKTLEALSKLIESFTRTLNQDQNFTKPERDALKANVNSAKNSLTDAMKQLEEIKSNTDITEEDKNKQITDIETNIKNIKDTLADTIANTKTGSTIHNDLLKSLDDLDPVTKKEVIDMQKTIRTDLSTLKSAFKNFKSLNGLSSINFDTYGYAWYEFLDKTKNVAPKTLKNFKNANKATFKSMISDEEFQNDRVHLNPTRKDPRNGYIDGEGNAMSRQQFNQDRINELKNSPYYDNFLNSKFVDANANKTKTTIDYTDPNYNRTTGQLEPPAKN